LTVFENAQQKPFYFTKRAVSERLNSFMLTQSAGSNKQLLYIAIKPLRLGDRYYRTAMI